MCKAAGGSAFYSKALKKLRKQFLALPPIKIEFHIGYKLSLYKIKEKSNLYENKIFDTL